MAEISDLTTEQQMLYWTGAISRGDVMLEHQLNQIFAHMTGPLAIALAPTGLQQHVAAIRRLVEEDPLLDAELKGILRDLLQEVEAAHRERNRLVHDLWWNDISPEGDPQRFVRGAKFGKPSPGPDSRLLRDFEVCSRRLSTCLFRLIAAGMLVSGHYFATVGHPMPSIWGADIDAQNRRIAGGHIEPNGDGSFKVL